MANQKIILKLIKKFREYLDKQKLNYIILNGSVKKRVEKALKFIIKGGVFI